MLNSCSHISFLQLMHCLKSARAELQVLFRQMSTCHRQKLPTFRHFDISQSTIAFFPIYLLGYALLDSLRTTANYFGIKFKNEHTFCLLIHHVHPFTGFLSCSEQQPSNKGDLDTLYNLSFYLCFYDHQKPQHNMDESSCLTFNSQCQDTCRFII